MPDSNERKDLGLPTPEQNLQTQVIDKVLGDISAYYPETLSGEDQIVRREVVLGQTPQDAFLCSANRTYGYRNIHVQDFLYDENGLMREVVAGQSSFNYFMRVKTGIHLKRERMSQGFRDQLLREVLASELNRDLTQQWLARQAHLKANVPHRLT